MRMRHALPLTLIAMSTEAAWPNEAGSQDDFSFRVNCTWSETMRSEGSARPVTPIGGGIAASAEPPKLGELGLHGMVEPEEVFGVRHFFTAPAAPPYILSDHVVVFPDGRGIQTQVYDLEGNVAVIVNLGTCVVIE